MEFIPAGPAEWRVVSAEKDWDRLQLGEALATFVQMTFDRDWRGFGSKRRGSFAIMRHEPARVFWQRAEEEGWLAPGTAQRLIEEES